MTELDLPELTYTFYDEQGRYLPDAGKNAQYYHRFHDLAYGHVKSDIADIQSLEVKKPDWFIEAEQYSYNFMSSLGFTEHVPVVLVREDTAVLARLGFIADRQGNLADAVTLNGLPAICFREVVAYEYFQSDGFARLLKTLVHERGHATVPQHHFVAQLREGGRSSYHFPERDWAVKSRRGFKGEFLEEGFCEWLGAWAMRCHVDSLSPPIAITDAPSIEVPDHYSNRRKQGIAGVDGYAMELIAWATEKQEILPADIFIANLFDARRQHTKAAALRENIHAINSLRPGLYRDLRELKYSRKAWHLGLKLVHNAVTTKP